MILRIDHVSLAVRDYEKAADFFSRVLGAAEGAGAEDGGMKYRWQLFALGDLSRLELLTPTGPGSYLDGFLAKKDGGVHHITLQVDDIRRAKENLEREKIPYFGFREYGEIWRELFIHPKDAFGVLIQLAQFKPDDWLPRSCCFAGDEKTAVEKISGGVRLSVKNPGGGIVKIDLSKEEVSDLIQKLNDGFL